MSYKKQINPEIKNFHNIKLGDCSCLGPKTRKTRLRQNYLILKASHSLQYYL